MVLMISAADIQAEEVFNAIIYIQPKIFRLGAAIIPVSVRSQIASLLKKGRDLLDYCSHTHCY